jgi:hypothetical protein
MTEKEALKTLAYARDHTQCPGWEDPVSGKLKAQKKLIKSAQDHEAFLKNLDELIHNLETYHDIFYNRNPF